MKPPPLLVAGTIAVLAAVSNLMPQDRYFLDLTRLRELPRPEKNSFGCGPRLGGGNHGGFLQPTATLALEIVSFDKSVYAVREDMVCQIRLVNVGKEPVRIPWNPNSDYGNKDCTGGAKNVTKASLTAWLALVFMSDDGSKRSVPLESLYGRLSIPDTFQVLHPGEAASIKFREPLLLPIGPPNEPLSRSLDLPQNFTVTATYNLDDTTLGNPYVTVNSRNHVKLTVEKAPTQRN